MLNPRCFFIVFGIFICCMVSCSKVGDEIEIKPEIDPSMSRITKIIAHRGYWRAEGACENSLAAAESAVKNGIDGIELDVWITSDDSVIVSHDATIGGKEIIVSSYEDLKDEMLVNGEKIPTIRDFLRLMKPYPKTELFIEVKANRAVERLTEIIKEEQIINPVIFISFNRIACDRLVSLDRSLHVEPLRRWDDDSSAVNLLDRGYSGLAYSKEFFYSHFGIIDEAIKNEMTLSSWLVNTVDEYDWFFARGFEYVISDNPAELVDKTLYSLDYWH